MIVSSEKLIQPTRNRTSAVRESKEFQSLKNDLDKIKSGEAIEIQLPADKAKKVYFCTAFVKFAQQEISERKLKLSVRTVTHNKSRYIQVFEAKKEEKPQAAKKSA